MARTTGDLPVKIPPTIAQSPVRKCMNDLKFQVVTHVSLVWKKSQNLTNIPFYLSPQRTFSTLLILAVFRTRHRDPNKYDRARHVSPNSSVVKASDRCTGGHGFDFHRILRFFLCPTLATIWILPHKPSLSWKLNDNKNVFSVDFLCFFLSCSNNIEPSLSGTVSHNPSVL